ncbi:MAG: pesticin C-terminus-like muramidase [Thermoanaerobaculia bacterium]|nr:pesticin C-terminus-like muramidase [Thermoanaerobaculia bacterium]
MTFDLGKAVDWEIVGAKEGGRAVKGYVPASLRNYDGSSKYDPKNPVAQQSGVTVATGFDIGQKSLAEIKKLEIPDELKKKLEPFAAKKGEAAVNLLFDRKGLELTPDEARTIDLAIPRAMLKRLAEEYDKAKGSGPEFYCLPKKVRTAVFSYAYQNGANANSYTGPKQKEFWKAVTEQRWEDAIAVLESYTLDSKRRKSEADLIRQDKDKPPTAPPIENGRCEPT